MTSRTCLGRPALTAVGVVALALGGHGAVAAAIDGEPPASVEAMTPEEVVTAQMTALSQWRNDPGAAAQVFKHASPANRAVTGPLSRFRSIVERDPFTDLLDNAGWSSGKVVLSGDAAVVLVTLVTPDGSLRAFRFYLSRQSEQAGGEWMTDAVVPLALPRESGGAGPEAAPRSAA